MSKLPKELQDLQESREGVYGPWRDNMYGTSRQMQGLFHNYMMCSRGSPLPKWWAPLMMVAVKLNRIASGNYLEDNFKDLRVYLYFVEQMQKEEAADAAD